MCGITGIIGFEDRALLQRMTDILAHRGPENTGLNIEKDVCLGHRRLSILDIKRGRQPMLYGDYTITYNGEIYNHLEIREELKDKQFKTTTDTETILHAYKELGHKCVEKFNGMFAFAIHDTKNKKVFLARDRMGIKPLYYLKTKEGILFASEIKALLAYNEYTPQVDLRTLQEITHMRYNLTENTLFKGIKSLKPAHYMIIDIKTRKIETKRYWKKEFEEKDGEYTKKLRDIFEDAVHKHLLSDVPVGIFLSGGLDSSAIAAMAQRHHHEQIKTFTIGFEQEGYNEFKSARRVAEYIGTDHKEKIIDNKTFVKSLPKLIWYNDEPITFQASVPLYHIANVAAKEVKVVLTGEGADELFAGYDKYYRYNQALKYQKYGKIPARQAIHEILQYSPFGKATITRIIQDPKESYKKLIEQNDIKETEKLLNTTVKIDVTKDFKNKPNDVLQLDQETYLQELLRKQDRMSMAVSIESRVPFLDYRMVELSREIPFKQKMPCKAILKQALKKDLPKEIIERKKEGFPVPIKEMIKEQRNILDEKDAAYKKYFIDPNREKNNMEWFLINFELWHKVFIERR